MQLFGSQFRINDVLPHVPIFNYFKYKYYYYLKKSTTFNSNAWMILYYDTWLNVNMCHMAFLNDFLKNINIRLVGT